MEKLIVTAAITGSRITRKETPYIPITTREIIDSAVEAYDAGASVVHIHVRDPKTGLGTQDFHLFKEVVEGIRKKSDVLICLTTSGIPGRNLSYEERMVSLELMPDMASFDAGSLNMERAGVFINPPDFLTLLANRMVVKGVKPELEIFDFGMIGNCLRLAEKGLLKKPLHFQFVLGVQGGAPATANVLLHMVDSIPMDATWSAIGIGANHLPIAMMAMILGGHVRVGLEDNIYYSKGALAKTNAELVARIVRIANEYGRHIATPDEARKILNLKK